MNTTNPSLSFSGALGAFFFGFFFAFGWDVLNWLAELIARHF
jgi:hypothetical protein